MLWNTERCLRLYDVVFPVCCRVEGQGSAVILDVVHYASVETKRECLNVLAAVACWELNFTAEEVEEREAEPGEYEAVLSLLKEKRDEARMVGFQVQVLEKKRELLRTFARHACHLHTKVHIEQPHS